jgi:hypothetical protein
MQMPPPTVDGFSVEALHLFCMREARINHYLLQHFLGKLDLQEITKFL